jgi:hypothetical protein
MQLTNPKDILTHLNLIRAGFASGLVTKNEIIDWADKIITAEDEPDIFFIDLALLRSKNENYIMHYFSNYLNFENPAVSGRPLLGLLYKKYKSGQYNLEQTTSKLFRLKSEVIFNKREENHIYWIDNEYDCAKHKIYGTIESVQIQLENFLILYKEYSLNNFLEWDNLNQSVDIKLEEEYQLKQVNIQKAGIEKEKPWWKFWR